MESGTFEKLTVLGESAKYDVSCSSSGHARVNVGRIGSAACAGICHTWTSDGRCLSLLKVLLSNDCVYDCKYCVNRRTADGARRTFEPKELAELTIEFYRRNYIEGLFLSSAVLVSPDHTAERMYECLWLLREVHGFAGYIHAKIVPGVSPELLTQIGLVADRLSVNIEMPTSQSLSLLAPQKKPEAIFAPMTQITRTQMEQRTLKAAGNMQRLRPAGYEGIDMGGTGLYVGEGAGGEAGALTSTPRKTGGHIVSESRRKTWNEKFAPAGQTTQMLIGASPESDRQILHMSEALYRRFTMKRVYFSAYIPVVDAPELPSLLSPPPLRREHRLYQADWLLRFYGFSADEILTETEPNLDYDLDPKVIWALRHIDAFPIEVNTASEAELLRIPGIGNVSARRILRQRRVQKVRYEDLKKMGVVMKRARYFLTCGGRYHGGKEQEAEKLRTVFMLESRAAEDAAALMNPGTLNAADIRRALGGGEKPQISLFEASL
ncbi:MAG: putative DNA modification/repair radical SAM protein [Clostridiales bacterium]|nr:putative DNA modification/repair radical SAM protein [Clostridiales bacterium]